MLSQLPKDFQQSFGGGMSFLNACENAKDEQWTGLHTIMEQLFVLGLASGKVQCLIPKDMWAVLPGGMPYYVISEKRERSMELTKEQKATIETINHMKHYEMCDFWRNALSGHPFFDKTQPFFEVFEKRLFKHFGGFTPGISKSIGWKQ